MTLDEARALFRRPPEARAMTVKVRLERAPRGPLFEVPSTAMWERLVMGGHLIADRSRGTGEES